MRDPLAGASRPGEMRAAGRQAHRHPCYLVASPGSPAGAETMARRRVLFVSAQPFFSGGPCQRRCIAPALSAPLCSSGRDPKQSRLRHLQPPPPVHAGGGRAIIKERARGDPIFAPRRDGGRRASSHALSALRSARSHPPRPRTYKTEGEREVQAQLACGRGSLWRAVDKTRGWAC